MDDVYEKLRQYMDKINPFGCPKTEDGSHLAFLKALFNPEEAEIFVQLSIHPEPVETIADRFGKSVSETTEKLEAMFRKATVLKRRENKTVSYGASVIGPGILEAIVAAEDDEVMMKMGMYLSQGVGASVVKNKTGLLRTIPIEMEIPAETKAQTYEKLSEVLHHFPKPIAVIEYGCRKMARKAGAGCNAPIENCLVFGDHALFHIENNYGRELTIAEALQILKEAEEAGLVHNTINFTDWEGASFLCNCCSCCCSTLASINRLYPKGEVCGISRSNYVADIDIEKCSGLRDMHGALQHQRHFHGE